MTNNISYITINRTDNERWLTPFSNFKYTYLEVAIKHCFSAFKNKSEPRYLKIFFINSNGNEVMIKVHMRHMRNGDARNITKVVSKILEYCSL